MWHWFNSRPQGSRRRTTGQREFASFELLESRRMLTAEILPGDLILSRNFDFEDEYSQEGLVIYRPASGEFLPLDMPVEVSIIDFDLVWKPDTDEVERPYIYFIGYTLPPGIHDVNIYSDVGIYGIFEFDVHAGEVRPVRVEPTYSSLGRHFLRNLGTNADGSQLVLHREISGFEPEVWFRISDVESANLYYTQSVDAIGGSSRFLDHATSDIEISSNGTVYAAFKLDDGLYFHESTELVGFTPHPPGIYRLDPSQPTQRTEIFSVSEGLIQFEFASDGSMIIMVRDADPATKADYGQDRLIRFDPVSGTSQTLWTAPKNYDLYDMALGTNGKILVTAGDVRKDLLLSVLEITPGSSQTRVLFTEAEGRSSYGALTFYGFAAVPGIPTESSLTVTAQHDVNAAPDVFGSYLNGVKLSNQFRVNFDGDAEEVKEVVWSVGTLSGKAKRPNGSDEWTFSIDMGRLPVGTPQLEVRAIGQDGSELATYTGTIEVTRELDFELHWEKSGTEKVDVEELRFVSGIATSVTMIGTLSDVPSFYQPYLKVYLGSKSQSVSFQEGLDNSIVFEFQRDLSALKAGTTLVEVEISKRGVTDFGDEKERLLVIARPNWLEGGNAVFNTETSTYQFRDVSPDVLKLQPPLLATDIKGLDRAFKKLRAETFFQIQTVFDVDAALQVTTPPILTGTELRGQARILGQNVWEATYSSDKVVVQASLNAQTLNPVSIKVSLPAPVELVNRQLMNQQVSINLVKSIAPAIPEWLVSATLNLALQAVGTITINAGVELGMQNNSVAWLASGTFLQVTSEATAEVQAGINAKILKGYVLETDATLTGYPKLSLNGEIRVQGAVTGLPQIANSSLKGEFELKYRLKANVTALSSATLLEYDSASDELGLEDDILGPYTLFEFRQA